MSRVPQALVFGFAFMAVVGGATAAAPSGRPVPTETIIIPPDQNSDGTGAMPDIPPDSQDAPADATPPAPEATEPPPTIEYDVGKLPTPVGRLREQLIEAAKSGEVEKLGPIIAANGEPPQFGFTEAGDPLAYLKSQSGDPEGREILAILLEVLEAGYVHVDVGTPDEMYVWPYFARYPMDKLTPPQMVELFKLWTAGDFQESNGAYTFYRLGITPNGEWTYFVAGD